MRQVPASPVPHFNAPMVFAIVEAAREAFDDKPGKPADDPSGDSSTVFGIMLWLRCAADGPKTSKSIAAHATELYAQADELSRLTITTSMVESTLDAIVDILNNEATLANALYSLRSEEGETAQIVERASALFHPVAYRSTGEVFRATATAG